MGAGPVLPELAAVSVSDAEDMVSRRLSISARSSELSLDGAGAAAVAVPASAAVGFAVVQPLTTKTIANTAKRILTTLKGLFIRPLAGQFSCKIRVLYATVNTVSTPSEN